MNAVERKAFAESIRPAVNGISDKFSWRLYQRALKRGRERVYISAWNNIIGDAFEPDFQALKAGCRKQRAWLMIGGEVHPEGFVSAKRLQCATRKGMGAIGELWSYGPGHRPEKWLDITDWFWDAYQRQGRCIIHGDQAHSWIKINRNARKCEYCGKHERRHVNTIKKIERREVWL